MILALIFEWKQLNLHILDYMSILDKLNLTRQLYFQYFSLLFWIRGYFFFFLVGLKEKVLKDRHLRDSPRTSKRTCVTENKPWLFKALETVKLIVTSLVYWRRQWHPTPVLLPGKSHGWRSLVGCSPWGC